MIELNPSPTNDGVRRAPEQARARATFEKLLTAAGELIAEVGIERISTNLIASRAGVSPPSFYHYFRDKYDILAVLGERLMAAQNALVSDAPEPSLDDIVAMLVAHVDVTRGFPGGPWVMRALRAVPALEAVRLESHRLMAWRLADAAAALDPSANRNTLFTPMRLCVEIGYGAVEMVFDEPDADVDTVMRYAAQAILAIAPWPNN